MPDPTPTPPAGATAGQPAGGTPAAAEESNKSGEDERQALRVRAIEAERKLAKVEEANKKAEDARLAEQGKHQELASKKSVEADDWRSKYQQEKRNNALISAGARAGVVDAGDLVALAKLGEVDVEDHAALQALAEKTVAELTKSKPYLFVAVNGKNGTPFQTPQANPGGAGPATSLPPGRITKEDVHKMNPEQLTEFLGHVKSGSKRP